MIKKLKVVTVVGTRPEIIRLACTMKKLDQHCDHVLVHSGQNYDYELNEIFFSDLGLRRPDHFLNAAGQNAAETIGKTIIAVDKVFAETKPDAVLVLGDTNSCLSVIPAKRRKIPIFHMEAGNRCFDQRVPEETNRRIVDHTADVNLTYSDIAREYLLREGFPPDRVIKTGSPMFEVLASNKERIDRSEILTELGLNPYGYFVVSFHREENVDSPINLEKFHRLLNRLAERYRVPVIVSTHPRTKKRIDEANLRFNEDVKLLKPLSFTDYVKLQQCSTVVLSDSGTISEESSILNFPALNVREAHERPEAMEEAAVMMVGLNEERALQGIEILRAQPRGAQRLLRCVAEYQVENVSDKVLRILHSYTDYVQRTVWKRY